MKAIIPTTLEKRQPDKWGAGHFGASRGSRIHHGIDYECPAFRAVLSPCAGKVTKHGYPYGDDLSFRYIEITDSKGYRHRIFYVSPGQPVGNEVKEGQTIGISQDLEPRYPEITPHIHYEVILDDKYINPENFKISLKET